MSRMTKRSHATAKITTALMTVADVIEMTRDFSSIPLEIGRERHASEPYSIIAAKHATVLPAKVQHVSAISNGIHIRILA